MKQLRIHYFQHVPFESPGNIEVWCHENGHTLTSTKFYENPTLPALAEIDWLVIMGGPMGVYDEKKYNWLADEKQFIKEAIAARKTIIGICLGSQLLAEISGAKVYPNKYKEIGWFPVELSHDAMHNKLFAGINSPITVFHWHGDTFDLPENAVHLAHSEACRNQAFLYKKNVLGLQFHLEMTKDTLKEMLKTGKSELTKEKYIQSEEEIRSQEKFIENNKKVLFLILDRLARQGY
ncbi:MAG TPA: type 1 glutamine amidotransferase [Hanamia sp.]|nr:type 1 glutamine amidotransferase [Hanamia sp.]